MVKKRGFFNRVFGYDKNSKSKLASGDKKTKVNNKKVVEKKPLAKKKGIKKKVMDKKPIVKKKFMKNKIQKNKVVKKKPLIKKKDVKKKVVEKKPLVEKKIVLTGIKGFDSLFHEGHGIPEGASILVEGGAGSGKTLFCLSTLANICRSGKKALYMSFEEPAERLIQHMEGFGWPAKKWVEQGLLRIQRFDALDVSRSIEALLSAAKKELLIEIDPIFFPRDYDPNFVVIDSLTSIASAFSGEDSRFRVYMEQLFRYLEKNKITNFLVREVASPSHIGTTFKEEGEAVSFLSDGIIVIYNVIYDSGKRDSAIEILKMRGTNFKRKMVKLEIKSNGGVFVFPDKILKRSVKAGFSLT